MPGRRPQVAWWCSRNELSGKAGAVHGAYQGGAVVRSHAREIWCSEVGEPDCHQIVTIGGRFRPFGALSSGCRRKKMPGKFGTYRASSAPAAGLKILVSAVQSRPSPPFLPHTSTTAPDGSHHRLAVSLAVFFRPRRVIRLAGSGTTGAGCPWWNTLSFCAPSRSIASSTIA